MELYPNERVRVNDIARAYDDGALVGMEGTVYGAFPEQGRVRVHLDRQPANYPTLPLGMVVLFDECLDLICPRCEAELDGDRCPDPGDNGCFYERGDQV